MDMETSEDANRMIQEAMPEKFILNDLQEGLGPCGNILALKNKKQDSVNLVKRIESRLLLVKYWIDGNEDQLSKDIETGEANLDKTRSKKKESEQIAEEILNYCAKIENDYHALQLKEKLLFEKVNEIKQKSAKCKQLKQEKMGKVVDVMGPNMPEQLYNFEEQMQLKVENAQQVYKISSANLKSLKAKASQLKTTCKKLGMALQEKETICKTLKQEQDEKISQMKDDFDISEQMINVYESFSNVIFQKSGKNFIQVKMTSEIGESESLLVTLYFKPSDYEGILLDDVHVSNTNLYISDCVKNVRCLKNIPACLNSIKERWHYYLHMAEHLKDIQERLPVDWIQQENKLRVVIGKNANIICTLKLPSTHQSCVTLLDVKGGDSEDKLDLLEKPSNPEASLQEWIECLEKQFS